MRRRDREVTDSKKIQEVIENSHCIRLGMVDDQGVYIVPLNFGYECIGDSYRFYFHGAKEGRKVDILKQNNEVGFELDTNYKLILTKEAHECTAAFESIIGNGKVKFIEDEVEKCYALNKIMYHDTKKDDWEFPKAMLAQTCIFSMDVVWLTCKVHT